MKFKYVKAGETKVGKKRMEILSVLNEGGKDLRKRLETRKIKIPDIVRVRLSAHNQVDAETSAVKSEAKKFYLSLKNGEKLIVNLSKFHKL